jgi:protein TonB
MVVVETRIHLPAQRQGAPAQPGPKATPPRHRVKERRPVPELLLQPVAPPPAVEDVSEIPEIVDDESESDGMGAGVPGPAQGDPNGAANGISGPGGFTQGPVRFDADRMTAPRRLSGPDPQYTPRAIEAQIEGSMLVRCILTADGTVYGCIVLKSLPFMDAAVIQALEHRRYTPALVDGRPVEVEYLF